MKKLIVAVIAVLLTNTASLAGKSVVTPILSMILDDSTYCPAEISTVTTPTGRVWMDRNLGASRVATSKSDSLAYGDLYQWGRLTDGHQDRSSDVTAYNATSADTDPGHSMFILSKDDWIKPPNDDLWQGQNGINNPCPPCFRLATNDEWTAASKGWKNSDDAFDSPLKLVVAGLRNRADGSLDGAGTHGFYWSGDVAGSPSYSYYFGVDSSFTPFLDTRFRAYGKSVRCIQN